MGRLIDIRWPEINVSVVAELADEVNPELCEEFWQHLPFKVLQAHPVVSGESIYAWTPIVSEAPVRKRIVIKECPVGQMRYSQATGNKFSIQYGPGLETTAQPILGKVLPEHTAVLPAVGKAAWENVFWRKEMMFVEVAPHDTNAPRKPRPTAHLPAVAQKWIAEAERIQTVEPEDLRKIRLGLIGDTGSYGQYFTAWDFANGMVRDYAMYTIFNMLDLSTKFTPAQMATLLDSYDPPYSEYLGYSGFKTLETFAGELRAAVRAAQTPDEVRVLLRAFLRYANRLCAWSYHYFPWHIGSFYPRRANGQDLPGRWIPATIAAAAE
jgi:hypothetical protein